jgi:uncharacterized protein (TIGR02271 family)
MNDNLIPLARLDDWQLEHERQDIRGWPVRDGAAMPLRTVKELLVDREHERVAAVTLSDGSTVPVERIAIREDHVQLKEAEAAGVGTNRDERGQVREERIPLVEEQIKVGKRNVERGGVRVSSRIVEQPVHEEVRLRDETVEVERRPVERDRLKPEEASRMLRDREVEMREMDEEAVVAKEALVTEEVVVRKEASERVEQIDESVRRTEVDVEQIGQEREGPSSR